MHDKNRVENRPAYDQNRSAYTHNLAEHRLVIEPECYHTVPAQYMRSCVDRDTGAARTVYPQWTRIQYVDFKIYADSQTCDQQWQELEHWLACDSVHDYRVLHWVNDGIVDAAEPWIVDGLARLSWQGNLYLDIVSRHRGTDDPNRTQQILLRAAPRGVCGLDYRRVYLDGICEHHQLKHPHGRRVIRYLY